MPRSVKHRTRQNNGCAKQIMMATSCAPETESTVERRAHTPWDEALQLERRNRQNRWPSHHPACPERTLRRTPLLFRSDSSVPLALIHLVWSYRWARELFLGRCSSWILFRAVAFRASPSATEGRCLRKGTAHAHGLDVLGAKGIIVRRRELGVSFMTCLYQAWRRRIHQAPSHLRARLAQGLMVSTT